MEKSNKKEAYIVYVDKYVGLLIPIKKHYITSYAPREKFVDFVQSIHETFPEYRMRCVRNESIEEYIRKKIKKSQALEIALTKHGKSII